MNKLEDKLHHIKKFVYFIINLRNISFQKFIFIYKFLTISPKHNFDFSLELNKHNTGFIIQ